MKWLKRIFQKDKADDQAASLRLSELDGWLDRQAEDPDLEKRVHGVYIEIGEVAKDLVRDLEALASAEPDETTPPRLLKAGLAARSEVAKQIDSLSKKIAPPEKKDIESASEYHWAAVKGLSNTVTKYGRAQRYVAALLPAESERINADFNRLSHLLVQLEEEIGKKRKEREEIWFCRELAAKIRQEMEQIDNLRADIKRDEGRLAELQASEKQLEAELRRLEASDQGRKALELKSVLDQKRSEMLHIEGDMADLVSPLAKALARIVKQGSSDRLSLQHREVLELLSRSPLEVLDRDIGGPLRELRDNLASLGLKDRKKEKTLEHLDRLIQDEPLQALKVHHAELEAENESLEQKLAESTREMVRLKENLARTKRDVRGLEPELNRNRESLAALEGNYSRDEAELNERIERIAGHPITIDLQPGRQ